MLGTRVILLGMNSLPGDEQGESGAEMLCAANHQIPIYWLLPFSDSDLQFFSDSSEPGATYPLLIARRTDLLTRLETRMQSLLPNLEQGDAELLQRWQVFLTNQPYPLLAIDTYELWRNRAEPDGLEGELRSVLKQIDKAPAEGLSELQAQELWKCGDSIALAGFGW